MGDSISEGTVVGLSKAVGEHVKTDDVVVVLETDKVSVDVRSPTSGTLTRHFSELEQVVEVGAPLFEIDSSVAASVEGSNAAAIPPSDKAESPPARSESPSTHHSRVPLIKFLGKRSALPSSSSSPPPPSHSSPPSTTVSKETVSVTYGRLPISEEEKEAVMTGYWML
jgi:pyruvate/2-oxoglutarate dehydrogenase complex dihydrolipoamide acyltransferase (E2) component